MIPLLTTSTVTRRRYASPTVTDYRQSYGAPSDTSVRVGGPQGAPASIREGYGDGFTARDVITFVSYDTDWRGSRDGECDRVVYDSDEYTVMDVTDSPTFIGQPAHVVVVAIRTQALKTSGAV